MKNALQIWIYGFSIMVLTGICLVVASLPVKLLARFFLTTKADSVSSVPLLQVVYLVLYMVFVPALFGWLLDRVLNYSTPRIRHALGKAAFYEPRR